MNSKMLYIFLPRKKLRQSLLVVTVAKLFFLTGDHNLTLCFELF